MIVYPDKFLQKKSNVIEKHEDITGLVNTMRATIRNLGYKGYGAVSAVQVGILKKIFIVKLPDTEVIAVNPKIIRRFGGKSKSWEICFSITGKVSRIKRYRKGEFGYFDENFKIKSAVLKGDLARIFYHEMDHLDGKMFLDRVENSDTDLMDEEEYWKMRERKKQDS